MKKARRAINRLVIALALAVVLAGIAGCGGSPGETPGTPGTPSGGAIAPNDSIVRVQVNLIRDDTGPYPKRLDILIITSEDVPGLANPTKSKLDSTIAAYTDQDLTAPEFGRILGSYVDAHIKQVNGGDKGVIFYIYNMKMAQQ